MLFKILTLLLLPLTALHAGCGDKHEEGTENSLPSLRIVLPYAFDDSSAASLILQGGNNNFRVNGTLGAYFTDQQRIKASYDFMEERLGFRYCTGKTHKWVNQSAGGLKYDYLFDDCTMKALTIGGFYSHAGSRSLSKRTLSSEADLYRHIAGSNYWNIDLGLTGTLWENGFIGLALNYGRLTYNYKYHDREKLYGLGGKITFDQYFEDSWLFHAAGEWKRFSRFIEGKIAKSFCFECGTFDFGIFASRLVGEHGLNNNTRYGIEITLGVQGVSPAQGIYTYNSCTCRTPCDLIGWISEAAVEMPAIYVVAEQKRVTTCTPPQALIAQILQIIATPLQAPLSIATASSFTGSNLTYTLSGAPAGVTIDPSTGVITVETGFEEILSQFNVIAANSCGQAQILVILESQGV